MTEQDTTESVKREKVRFASGDGPIADQRRLVSGAWLVGR